MGIGQSDIILADGLAVGTGLEFTPEEASTPSQLPPWDILIVDDDPVVHRVTQIVLRDFSFDGKGLQFESTYAAGEAKALLSAGNRFALILLDVVMEHDEAGLELVSYIRHELRDNGVQIVLRTGQPGIMCETDVILKYAINDYRTKTELTAQRLMTTVATSLRAYSLSQQLTEVNAQLIRANKEVENHVRERTQELLEAKETAEYTLRQRSEMLAHITHDLRSPLSGVLGLTQFLATGGAADDRQEIYDTIVQSCEQLLELVNDIMDFSRIEAGALSITKVNFNLYDTLESVSRLMKPLAYEKGLSFSVDYSGEIPQYLLGDPARLKQILQNLVSNAIKFTLTGEVRIRVAVDHAGGPQMLSLHVTDTGVGIAPEMQQAIFERYKQVESAQSSSHKGSGLGLFITKHLVAMMGGHINMHSEVGRGTTFAVRLPLEYEQDTAEVTDDDKTGDVHIYILDTTTATVLRRKLTALGISVGDHADILSSQNSDTSSTVAIFDQATFKRLLTGGRVSELNKFQGIIWVKTADLVGYPLDQISVPLKTLRLPLRTSAVAEACDELLGLSHKKELSHKEHSTVWPNFNLNLIIVDDERVDLQLLKIFMQKLKCNMKVVDDPMRLGEDCSPEDYHAVIMSCHTLKRDPQVPNIPIIVFADPCSGQIDYSACSVLVEAVLETPCQPVNLISLLENFIMAKQLSNTHTFSIH